MSLIWLRVKWSVILSIYNFKTVVLTRFFCWITSSDNPHMTVTSSTKDINSTSDPVEPRLLNNNPDPSATYQPCSATNNKSTLNAIIEGKSLILHTYSILWAQRLNGDFTAPHSEIVIDTQSYKTPSPRNKLLKDDTFKNQTLREKEDANGSRDEGKPSNTSENVFKTKKKRSLGVQNQAAGFPSREKRSALPRPKPTDLSKVAKGRRSLHTLTEDDDENISKKSQPSTNGGNVGFIIALILTCFDL